MTRCTTKKLRESAQDSECYSQYCSMRSTCSRVQDRHVLAELYIEALLVDEQLADQVWELWQAGLITDSLAACNYQQQHCGMRSCVQQ